MTLISFVHTVANATSPTLRATPMANIFDAAMPPVVSNTLQSFFVNWLKLDITTIAAVLTVFGTISGILQTITGVGYKVYWWLLRLFTASISIDGYDRLNREVINWLGSQVLTRQGTRILTARSEVLQSDAHHWRQVQTERDDYQQEKRVPVQYLPTFGYTWFIFEYNLFMVRRVPGQNAAWSRHGSTPDEYCTAPKGDEPLVVMCLGRSVEPIKNFLDHCRDFAEQQRNSFTTVRSSKGIDRWGSESWDSTIVRPIRPLETVHFDEETKKKLVLDIENYLAPTTREFYNARGIPYRRGYLLHGPPGTGKTSLALALAGHFGLELYLCHMPSVKDDTELEKLFATLPPRCIVLLEDIDAVGIKKRKGLTDNIDDDDDTDEDDEGGNDSKGKSRPILSPCRCSLSGLLNVLDGVSAQEGRIVLLTSNRAVKLDPALMRPGRVDGKIFLGNISKRSAELMFLRMYSPESIKGSASTYAVSGKDGEKLKQLAVEFGGHIPDETLTPAHLQGFLLNYRDDPEKAAKAIPAWVAEETTRMDEEKRRAKEAAKRRAKKRKEAKLMMFAEMLSSGDAKVGADKPAVETKAAEDLSGEVKGEKSQASTAKSSAADP